MKKRIYLVLLLILLLALVGQGLYKNHYNKARDIVSLPDLNPQEEDQEGGEVPFEEDKMEEEENVEEEEEGAKKTSLKLLAVGDIMFHSPQFRGAYDKESDSYDFRPSFQYVKKYIEEADLALGNFESVTGGKELGFHGFPRFNSPKETLLALAETGFDILSTANNHSLDQGKRGLIGTIDRIEEYGMKNLGTYREPGRGILIEEVNDIRLGLLSYTYGLNGLDPLLTKEELAYMVNLIDEETIRADIDRAKDKVDLIVVQIHWGHEYHREPSSQQMELAEKMVDWGANIILGSHPHVIQKSQLVSSFDRDNFIIYSLGNFISNQRRETMGNPYTEDGLIVEFEIEKDLSSGETIIKTIDYIPTWTYKYWQDGRMNFEVLPLDGSIESIIEERLTGEEKSRLDKSYRDTMEKMAEN